MFPGLMVFKIYKLIKKKKLVITDNTLVLVVLQTYRCNNTESLFGDLKKY